MVSSVLPYRYIYATDRASLQPIMLRYDFLILHIHIDLAIIFSFNLIGNFVVM